MTRFEKALSVFMLALLLTPVRGSSAETIQMSVLSRGLQSWLFVTDPRDRGLAEGWFQPDFDREAWRRVRVPHTWQVENGTEDYFGVGWYATQFESDPLWKDRILKVCFDAVHRDATVWFNGRRVGEHRGSGWTAFCVDVTDAWKPAQKNLVVVRASNRFSAESIPYKDSFDWANNGGIIRPVTLRALPSPHLAEITVRSRLNDRFSEAVVEARVRLESRNPGGEDIRLETRLFDPNDVLVDEQSLSPNGATETPGQIRLSTGVENPQLWHFDSPNLYRLQCRLFRGDECLQSKAVVFGIRHVEVRDGRYFVNGEQMRLIGVEWMPGSDPRYGMAEPSDIIQRSLRDLKELNAVITRFHWQQPDEVFEFCDREGILVQEEIPAWGPRTMETRLDEIQAQQTGEMVSRHFNHPSIYAWGLCNEIDGQRPETHRFVRRGIKLTRALDPTRLLTWASNTLHRDPTGDAGGLGDFLEWNDYWESWYGGSLQDVERSLEQIASAYPGKSLVVSEYGLCECDPRNPSGDDRRIEILKTHTDLYRKSDNVAGAIFFDYNDYRTHIGDKGQGVFRQRVHGVVDLLGRRKPSFEALRIESSPIKTLEVQELFLQQEAPKAVIRLQTRALEKDFPAYTLRKYRMFWAVFNKLEQPIATGVVELPVMPPGTEHTETIRWEKFSDPGRIQIEVFRPTGYSVHEAEEEL